MASKREEVSSAKRRYDDGLEKVISTEEQAGVLRASSFFASKAAFFFVCSAKG